MPNSESLIGQKVFWHHYEITEHLQHKTADSLWTWATKLRRFFEGDSVDRKAELSFMHFYLKNTSGLCLLFLPFNIVLLLCAILVIVQGRLRSATTDPFSAYAPAVVEIVIWIALSVLVLSFFIAWKYKPGPLKRLTFNIFCDYWYEIGAALLLSRFLILVVRITHIVQSGGQCMDAMDLVGADDDTFGYMLIKMTVDTYQAFVMVMLPFPQPWGAAMTLVELFRQITRLQTCERRITTDANQQWIGNLALTMLFYCYVVMLLIPSVYLESSFRIRFRRIQMQREAEQSKREMVGFLSTDVRVPLQYMLHAISSVDFVGIAGSNVQPLLSDIHRYSAIVNDIADELLLLVRIKESRYKSKQIPVEDLRCVLDGAVESFRYQLAALSPSAVEDSSASEAYVHVTTPAVRLEVDESCLLAIVRHLLVFLTQEPKRSAGSNAERQNADTVLFEAAQHRPQVHVYAHVQKTKGSTAGEVVVRVTGKKQQEKWSESRQVQQATTSYVCATIAVACAGTFVVQGEGDFVLTLPCVCESSAGHLTEGEVGAEPGADDMSLGAGSVMSGQRSVGTNRHSHEALRLDQALLEEKIKMSANMLARFKRHKVCAVVADTVLERVITSAIHRMKLNDGLTVLHELQRGSYVPVAMLTFVTSYELCVELRLREYQGLVVLFSGSINYLDDAQITNLDYCLPLPSSDLHIVRFIEWLVGVHDREAARNAAAEAEVRDQGLHKRVAEGRRDSLQTGGKARVKGTASSSRGWWTVTRLFLAVAVALVDFVRSTAVGVTATLVLMRDCIYSKSMFFMVVPLPPGTLEGYTKWKILNPAGSWYHRSAEVWFRAFPRFIFGLFLETLVFKNQLTSVVPICFITGLMMVKESAYKFVLKPRGWKLHHYWLIMPVLASLYYLISILQDTGSYDTKPMTLQEFQQTKFVDRSGRQQLYGAILSSVAQRMYSMSWIHPLNLLLLVLTYARTTQVLWTVLRCLASLQMAQYLQIVYTQVTLLNMVYLTHQEHSYRAEFIATYDHILSKVFLDQCLDICQQDIRKPLEILLGRKNDLMQVLNRAALSRAFTIDKTVLTRLEPLQVSHMLLSEMVSEFGYSQYLLPVVEGAALVRQPVEALQLGRAVADIVSAFSSSSADYHVRLVAEVDHQLAVIRVDWRMLSVILTNLINAALRNIRDDCIETPRNKDLINTIFIKFVALNTEEKVPFVAPRVMLVNVCDSSSRAALLRDNNATDEVDAASVTPATSSVLDASESTTFQYGRSMCGRLVQKVSPNPIFHTIYSAESPLKTVQRFTFPYQLSPQTRRAQEHLLGESELPYVTVRVCPSTYWAAYERIVLPRARTKPNRHGVMTREQGKKHIVLLSCVDPKMKVETLALAGRLESYGWHCVLKYVLKVPSMQSIGVADCVLIDQQLELQERVSVCEIVLKLRVCGFSGLIAVVLQENHRETEGTKDELARSAASADLVLYAPVTEQKVQALTAAMERKCIKQALSMNGN
jgi:signal transduction histidine kinase